MKNTFLFLVLLIIIQSCTFNSSGTKKNSTIDRRKREEIKALNDKLFKAIKSEDIATVKELFSDSLKATINMDDFMKSVSSGFAFEKYTTLDEYNFIGNTNKLLCELKSENGNVNDYDMKYTLSTKEAYTSLLLVPKGKHEFLILVTYEKVAENWKIKMIYSGQYRLFGKTAPDFYLLAKQNFEKGNFIDAIDYSSVSKDLLETRTKFFNYSNQDTMYAFFNKVFQEVNKKYELPLTLNNVESQPVIYNVTPQLTSDGIFPRVYYTSTIDLNNESALKQENEAVKKEADRIFNGLNQNKNYVFYFVSNEMPEEGRVGEQYGFVDTLSTH